jgi:hypothetical protein
MEGPTPIDARRATLAAATPEDSGLRSRGAPTVSVVLTCYNAAWCVERALDSVFAQTHQADEVLVTDDGSTDDTVERIRARYGDAVTVHRLPHAGLTPSRRAGVAAARGAWIALLDADDVWMPEKLERQLDFLARHAEVRWLSTDGVYRSAEGVIRDSWLSDYFDPVTEMQGDLLPALVERCFPLLSSSLVCANAYRDVGGFDPSIPYSQDYDLWLRLAARYPGAVLAQPLVTYWSGPAQLSRRFEERYRDDLRLMEKVARGELRRDRTLQRVAARKVSTFEFELAVTCARSGRMREARVRLGRVARLGGPLSRRVLALCGALAPRLTMPHLMRSVWVKDAGRRSRRKRIRTPASSPGART